jgi:general secretion pathway protein C
MLVFWLLVVAASSPPEDLTAVGLVLSHDPARCVAVLHSAGRTRIARVGEKAFGGRVAAVEPGVVFVEYGDTRLELPVTASRETRAPAHEQAPAQATLAHEAASPGTVMRRQDVERRLSEEVGRILAETTLVPVTEGGAVAGFALTRIPEGSLLTDAGLQAGDVLVSINGIPIDSRATLLALWPRLQGESFVRAEVLRGGRPVTLAVTLK